VVKREPNGNLSFVGFEMERKFSLGSVLAIIVFVFTTGGIYANFNYELAEAKQRVTQVETVSRQLQSRVRSMEVDGAITDTELAAIRADLQQIIRQLERLEDRLNDTAD